MIPAILRPVVPMPCAIQAAVAVCLNIKVIPTPVVVQSALLAWIVPEIAPVPGTNASIPAQALVRPMRVARCSITFPCARVRKDLLEMHLYNASPYHVNI